ncbi:MAG TPA: hypothetical protein VM012_04020, partial [Flavitalea sp.]|nr:hypothetical protein [Flavitalea sp.]
MNLAVVTSHPIQYNAPLFRLIAQEGRLRIKIFYTWGKSVLENKFDPGFGRVIDWDIPLLDGYEYEFLENTAVDKGTHHFKGIINPGIIQKIESFKPDALLVFGWSFVSHLKVMRAFHKKIPVLFRGDSTFLDPSPWWKSQLRRIALQRIYKNVDIAFYTGQHNKEYFLRVGIPVEKLIHALHAVDNDRFSGD